MQASTVHPSAWDARPDAQLAVWKSAWAMSGRCQGVVSDKRLQGSEDARRKYTGQWADF